MTSRYLQAVNDDVVDTRTRGCILLGDMKWKEANVLRLTPYAYARDADGRAMLILDVRL